MTYNVIVFGDGNVLTYDSAGIFMDKLSGKLPVLHKLFKLKGTKDELSGTNYFFKYNFCNTNVEGVITNNPFVTFTDVLPIHDRQIKQFINYIRKK